MSQVRGASQLTFLAFLATFLAWGCSSAPRPSASASEAAAPTVSAQLAEEGPLTADETTLLAGLRERAAALLAMGERNEGHIWELAEAADYVALSLESMGYPVQRQGFETQQVAAQNLTVSLPGGARGDQVLVVAAHYDSPSGSSGQAAAWSTAALLELARLMSGARLTRSLRLTFLSMGEAPHARGHACAAGHSAAQLVAEATQRPKPGLPPAVASAGIIEPVGVLVLGDLLSVRAGSPVSQVGEAGVMVLRSSALLPLSSSSGALRVEQLLAEGFDDGLVQFERRRFRPQDCDARAFADAGLPVVALGRLPIIEDVNADASLPSVLPERPEEIRAAADADWAARQVARVVMRIRAGIGQILAERPSNDGTMTLGLP